VIATAQMSTSGGLAAACPCAATITAIAT
jgi:hypothetical protein